VINAGGIPQKNEVLNRVYANVLNKTILVPAGIPTSLGSGIFALLAAGAYKTIEEAQAAVCLPLRAVEPDRKSAEVYEKLYRRYRDVYFGLGTRDAMPAALGKVLPELRKIAAEARKA
jgi:L-ribulokinase